jgi:hypothetical protein
VTPPPPEPEPEIAAKRVVLVTLDGVRWEDALGSHGMPNLERLVRERGTALGDPACPHPMRASGPNFVSLPGYLEIFTGHASKCTHNYCPPVATSTVLDEARATGDVAVFASWSRYANAVARDRRAIVLSAGQGAKYRPDVQTARIGLKYLERASPRLFVLGLGDADEDAHRGNIAGYHASIERADGIIGELDRTLARMGDAGRETAVLVTTDHGRASSLFNHGASFPESQRVWVAAFGPSIASRGVACADETLRLADIAGAVRSLLSLEGETGNLTAEIVRHPSE